MKGERRLAGDVFVIDVTGSGLEKRIERGSASAAPLDPGETKAHAKSQFLQTAMVTEGYGVGGAGERRAPAGRAEMARISGHWWDGDELGLATSCALGVDVGEVLESSRVVDRRRIAAAVKGHALTRSGSERSDRLFSCGHLRPAIRGTEVGLSAWSCGDRLCPSCAESRAREYASALRAFASSRVDEGYRHYAVTLTQQKMPVVSETCSQSVDRIIDAVRRLTNSGSANGRRVRSYWAGGIRGVEITWSPRGKRRKDGSRVEYSGWHAHIHAIFELKEGVDDDDALDVIIDEWLKVSPGASEHAQYVQFLDDRMIGETAKYPLKLPDLDRPWLVRDAAMSIAGRRMLDGFGSWRSALGKGRLLRDLGAPPRVPLKMADAGVSCLSEPPESLVSFTSFKGRDGITSFYRSVGEIRSRVLRDPRTLKQRDRDRKNNVPAPESDITLVELWDRIYPYRAKGRLRRG